MCKKLTLICIVLALVSTSYGYVIGDWESTSSLDGWSNNPSWTPQGHPLLYPGMEMYNSLGDASLLMMAPVGPEPFYWQMWIDLGGNNGAKTAMLGNSQIRIDVTRPAEYWVEDEDPETITASWFKVAVLGGGSTGDMFGTFKQVEVEGLCEWNGTSNKQTLVVSYPNVVDAGWWLQIIIGTNNVGWAEGGVYYFDNAQIVPEPMTIALLGLGGLTLLRKKH